MDGPFTILTTSEADRARWAARVARLPASLQDIHYLPEYALIYERTYGHRGHLAVYEDPQGVVILPFMLRSIGELPFATGSPEGASLFDITSPYGYGGPVVGGVDDAHRTQLLAGFFRSFRAYCAASGIVSEFASLHPLLENHLPLESGAWVSLDRRKQIVWVDLTKPEERLWQELSSSHRRNAQRAQRSGVQVEREPVAGEPLAIFRRLYAQTMTRRHAGQRWLFPERYFSDCAECLGPERVSLFSAKLDGTTIAQYLLMHDFGTVYYHFGGSSEEHFDVRPNNLLMYEIIRWAKRAGFQRLHLGGGVSAEDGLYRFKAGFSPETAWLYTYGFIHLDERYRELCARRDEWAGSHGLPAGDTGFFPAYRR